MSCFKTQSGKMPCKAKELNLHLTLLGGQSFRWKTQEDKKSSFYGVAFGHFWNLSQTEEFLEFTAHGGGEKKDNDLENKLKTYFRLDFNLSENLKLWKKSHNHFKEKSEYIQSVRVLNQEPVENLISFICSQNNHINRITSMVEHLCSKYGEKIYSCDGVNYYSFPTLEAFSKNLDTLEDDLRKAKFGYRAKFISGSIKKINELGGIEWFDNLRALPYKKARQELVKLPGIGYKVADCICLMSLGHLQAVPIDTHIFQIAQKHYMPEALSKIKSVTPKIYDDISDKFRDVYGEYAGWAQTILFCAQLSRFKEKEDTDGDDIKLKRSKKAKKC
ncbi:OGG1 family protein [Megaselia abdita]